MACRCGPGRAAGRGNPRSQLPTPVPRGIPSWEFTGFCPRDRRRRLTSAQDIDGRGRWRPRPVGRVRGGPCRVVVAASRRDVRGPSSSVSGSPASWGWEPRPRPRPHGRRHDGPGGRRGLVDRLPAQRQPADPPRGPAGSAHHLPARRRSGLATVEWRLDGTFSTGSLTPDSRTAGTQFLHGAAATSVTVTVTPPSFGTHTLQVRATDRAGNLSQNALYSFYVPSNPTPQVKGDLTGDGVPDLLVTAPTATSRCCPARGQVASGVVWSSHPARAVSTGAPPCWRG